MENTKVCCPICGSLTVYYKRRKKHRFKCPNNECDTHLEIDRESIFLDSSKKKESENWRRYRYKRLTFDELDTVVKGGRVLDKEHDLSKQGAKDTTTSKGPKIESSEGSSLSIFLDRSYKTCWMPVFFGGRERPTCVGTTIVFEQ